MGCRFRLHPGATTVHKMRETLVVIVSLLLVRFGEGAPLPKPHLLEAKLGTFIGNQVNLGWIASEEEIALVKEYRLRYYPADSLDSEKTTTVNGNETVYQVEGLRFHTRYFFILSAVDKNGDEGLPAIANITTGEGTPLEPPRNVKAERAGSDSVKVSWSPPPSDSLQGTLTGYKIRIRDSINKVDITHSTRKNELSAVIHLPNVTNDRFFVRVAAVTWLEGVYSEEIPVVQEDVSGDDSSLVIIMCCAIIIPVVLIGIFIAFYILVLRPAFRAGKENIEEDIPDMEKSHVKLTDLSAKVDGNTVKSTNGDSGIVTEDYNKCPL
ncbi:contactin-3-like isoform X2 [Oscarella lobularis]|uniref:contactin-3-like isoform X2 n=1 Tax=Oscarella lobularis TaxID=121494 RepID=UPI003313E944